jgi:hypothetical protein
MFDRHAFHAVRADAGKRGLQDALPLRRHMG